MLEALERELVIAKQHEAAELDETGGQAKLNVPTKSSNKDQIYKSTLSSTPSNENDPRSEWRCNLKKSRTAACVDLRPIQEPIGKVNKCKICV